MWSFVLFPWMPVSSPQLRYLGIRVSGNWHSYLLKLCHTAMEYEYSEKSSTDRLECAICRSVFINPMMIPNCGHVFCVVCIHQSIEITPNCPIDRTPATIQDLVAAPRVIQQIVDELLVICPNRERGCMIDCERGMLEDHLHSHCEFNPPESSKTPKKRKTQCTLCGERVESHLLSTHAQQCSSVPVDCTYCGDSIQRKQMAAHFLTCPTIPVPCPHAHFGCSSRASRDSMDDHVQNYCKFEPIKEFFQHYENRLEATELENWNLRQMYQDINERIIGLSQTSTNSLQSQLSQNWIETEGTSERFAQFQQTLQGISTEVGNLETQMNTHMVGENRALQEELQTLRAGQHGMRMQIHFLMMEMQRLTGSNSIHSPTVILPRAESRSDSIESNSEDEHVPNVPHTVPYGWLRPHPTMYPPGHFIGGMKL